MAIEHVWEPITCVGSGKNKVEVEGGGIVTVMVGFGGSRSQSR
jgi:hypothetical protein